MKSFGLGILLLSVAMFAGCGKKDEAKKTTEVKKTETKDGKTVTTEEKTEKSKTVEGDKDKKMGDAGKTDATKTKTETKVETKTETKPAVGDKGIDDLDVSPELEKKAEKK